MADVGKDLGRATIRWMTNQSDTKLVCGAFKAKRNHLAGLEVTLLDLRGRPVVRMEAVELFTYFTELTYGGLPRPDWLTLGARNTFYVTYFSSCHVRLSLLSTSTSVK